MVEVFLLELAQQSMLLEALEGLVSLQESQLALLTSDNIDNKTFLNQHKHNLSTRHHSVLNTHNTHITQQKIQRNAPISKVKAQHLLTTNREKLMTILKYSISIEEFKQKMSPPDSDQASNEFTMHSRMKMDLYAKKYMAIQRSLYQLKQQQQQQQQYHVSTSPPPSLKQAHKFIPPFPQREQRRKAPSEQHYNCLPRSMAR